MRSAMPIAWHKECLNSIKNSLAKKKKELETLKLDVQRLENEYKIREYQIQEAERQGKETFDRERFLKSKSK